MIEGGGSPGRSTNGYEFGSVDGGDRLSNVNCVRRGNGDRIAPVGKYTSSRESVYSFLQVQPSLVAKIEC